MHLLVVVTGGNPRHYPHTQFPIYTSKLLMNVLFSKFVIKYLNYIILNNCTLEKHSNLCEPYRTPKARKPLSPWHPLHLHIINKTTNLHRPTYHKYTLHPHFCPMSNDQLRTNEPIDVIIIKTAFSFFLSFFNVRMIGFILNTCIFFLLLWGFGEGGDCKAFKSILLCFEHLKIVLLGVVGFVIRIKEAMGLMHW